MEEVNVTTQNIEETAPAESMADYAGEIESSMREISVGDILEGTVVGLTDTEVTVDLQYAAEGIIRTQDYSGLFRRSVFLDKGKCTSRRCRKGDRPEA